MLGIDIRSLVEGMSEEEKRELLDSLGVKAPVAKGKKAPSPRYKRWGGHAQVTLCRCMGREGWSVEEIRAALVSLTGECPRTETIKFHVNWGIRGIRVPELTAEQWAALRQGAGRK